MGYSPRGSERVGHSLASRTTTARFKGLKVKTVSSFPFVRLRGRR